MMRLMRRAGRLGAFVAIALMAVLAAACTRGSATPNLSSVSSTPPSSSLASESPTPSPSAAYPADVPLTGHNVKPGERPPRYPAAAAAHTQAGANAFAEFFLHTWDWAYATTNASYMKHYYGPTCGLCIGIATGITKTAREHHWFLGGRLTVHTAETTTIGPTTAPAQFCALDTIDETAYSTVDNTGKIYTGDGAHRGDRVKACMAYTDGEWLITYLAGVK